MKWDALRELVNSLTRREQGYFRRFAAQRNAAKDNAYMQLFDHLLSGDPTTPAIKNLPETANYLQEAILKCLRSYHRDKTHGLRMRRDLDEIELLIMRGLRGQALKKIKKARTRARKQDNYSGLMELIDWELRLMREGKKKGREKRLKELVTEEEALSREWESLRKLRSLHDRVYYLLQEKNRLKDAKEIEELETLLSAPILASSAAVFSFKARIIFHYTHIFGRQLLADFETMAVHFQEMIALWKERPDRIQAEPDRYVTTWISYLDTVRNLGDFEGFQVGLKEVEAFQPRSQALKARIFFLTSSRALLWYMDMGKWEQAYAKVPEILAGLTEYEKDLSIGVQQYLWYNLAVFYFLTENFSSAVPWVNKITYLSRNESHPGIAGAAARLELILCYELGKYFLLESRAQSYRRKLKKEATPSDALAPVLALEQNLIDFLMGIEAGLASGHLESTIFREYWTELEAISEEDKNRVPGWSEVEFWVRSRCQGKPIKEIMASKD